MRRFPQPGMVERHNSRIGNTVHLANHNQGLSESITDPELHPRVLVLPGGGMRGVYSAAGLAALEHLHSSEEFDYVIGTSSGAINASYFVSEQSRDCYDGWMDVVPTRNFVNFRRLGRIMDVNHLHDHLMTEDPFILDQNKIQKSPVELLVSLTNFRTGRNTIVSARGRDDIPMLVKASSAPPILFNEEITVDDERYCDGAITNNIPMQAALKLKPKHVVVMASDNLENSTELGVRIAAPFLRAMSKLSKMHENLVNGYRRGMIDSERNRQTLMNLAVGPEIALDVVFPIQTIGRLCVDRRKVVDAGVETHNAVLAHLAT